MKKILKIFAVLVAIVLIFGVLFVANAFVGNPVSKHLVKSNSKEYISQNYSDLDLQSDVLYDFKNNCYYVRINSETIEDLSFTLYYNLFGELRRDTYENNITNGWNVLRRLDEDYRKVTDLVFEKFEENDLFKNAKSLSTSAYLVSKIETEDRLVGYEDFRGGIDGTKLELDKEYDINEMGKIGGWIDVSFFAIDGDESLQAGAECLKEIRKIFDEANVNFALINFGVYNKEGNYAYLIKNFPYEEIYGDDLVEKMIDFQETDLSKY